MRLMGMRVSYLVPHQRAEKLCGLSGVGEVIDVQQHNGAWFVLVLDRRGGLHSAHYTEVIAESEK